MTLPIKSERLMLTWSRSNAQLVAEVEAEIRREIEAAVTLGEVESRFPTFADDMDAWYEAVFGATERELGEMASDAVRRRRQASRWTRSGRRQRREALRDYLYADRRPSVAFGLETVWR